MFNITNNQRNENQNHSEVSPHTLWEREEIKKDWRKGTILFHWWKCKLGKHYGKQYSTLKKWKLELPYNPTIPLLSISLKEIKPLFWKHIHIPCSLKHDSHRDHLNAHLWRNEKRKCGIKNSLVAQWLGFWAFTTMPWGQSLSGNWDPASHLAWWKKREKSVYIHVYMCIYNGIWLNLIKRKSCHLQHGY